MTTKVANVLKWPPYNSDATKSSPWVVYRQGERQTTKFDNLCLPSRLNRLPFCSKILCKIETESYVNRWSEKEKQKEK